MNAETLFLAKTAVNALEAYNAAEKTSIGLNATLVNKFLTDEARKLLAGESHKIYGKDKSFTTYALYGYGDGSLNYVCGFSGGSIDHQQSDRFYEPKLEETRQLENINDLNPGVAISYVYDFGSKTQWFHLYFKIGDEGKWYVLSMETENGFLKNHKDHPGYFLKEYTSKIGLYILEYDVREIKNHVMA
jgi:hypothetical protein